MNKQINKVTESMTDAIDKNIEFQELVSGADANDGFVDGFEKGSKALQKIEHDMSIKIPNATQQAIDKFESLNNEALSNLQNKMSFIKETIAVGMSDGITKVSEGIARSVVLGEKLGNVFQRIAQDAVIKILQGLIEIGIRMLANIAIIKIEEMFGRKKKKNQDDLNRSLQREIALRAVLAMFGGGGGGGGIPFMNKGGAVAKGQPVVVGESGAELFIPNQTGQITQSARGTGGGAVNVNFTINAVDASGIDRLLVERRGTISRIINESVNERGSSNLI